MWAVYNVTIKRASPSPIGGNNNEFIRQNMDYEKNKDVY
jgi:hypothetical protein